MWTQLTADRWTMDDEVRHLLLHADDQYVELHGTTVHLYTGPIEVADPSWPLGDPFTYNPDEPPVTSWVRTEPRDDLAQVTDEEAFTALADVH